MVLGTTPDGEIEDVAELLPDEKVIEDWEHIETTTETIALKSHRLCMPLLDYLRSVFTNQYKEGGGPDFEYLMVSCPRVIAFELYVVDKAIKLLKHIGQKELFHRTSLDEDKAELERVKTKDPGNIKLISILTLNVTTK